jgi:hypothetical protein
VAVIKDSILNTTKKLLGIDPAYTQFDTDILVHINTTFSTLHQLGIGGALEFQITDETDVWTDFIGTVVGANSVRSLMYYKVKLVFDPPATSFAQKAMEDQAAELEWRLRSVYEMLLIPATPIEEEE